MRPKAATDLKKGLYYPLQFFFHVFVWLIIVRWSDKQQHFMWGKFWFCGRMDPKCYVLWRSGKSRKFVLGLFVFWLRMVLNMFSKNLMFGQWWFYCGGVCGNWQTVQISVSESLISGFVWWMKTISIYFKNSKYITP